MSKLTLYLPDALEKPLRKKARERRSSLSALVVEVLEKQLGRSRRRGEYQAALELFGEWKGTSIDLPSDPPLKPSDPLR